MKTLTSISKHSDWLDSIDIVILDKWNLHRKRVNFGKQPLAIYQFVPCKLVDGEWVVLEEPNFVGSRKSNVNYCEEYQEALDKVLFEGFWLDETYKKEKRQLPYLTNGKVSVFLHSDFAIRHQFIEDLIDLEIPLTKTALKEIGL